MYQASRKVYVCWTNGYSTLFEKGSWKLIKGSRLIVKGTKKGTPYCLHCKALMGKFIALPEIHSYVELCHKRLGHMSQNGLDKLVFSLLFLSSHSSPLPWCFGAIDHTITSPLSDSTYPEFSKPNGLVLAQFTGLTHLLLASNL